MGFVVHGALWSLACSRLQSGYQEVVAQARREGWTVAAGQPVWSGWPAAASIELPSLSITGDPAVFPGGLAWTAERLTLSVHLAHPSRLIANVQGHQTLEIEPAPPISIDAGQLSARIALDGAARPILSGLDVAANVAARPVRVRSFVLHTAERSALLEAQGISIGESAPGAEIDELRLGVILAQPIPPGTALASRAQRWREAGGTVDMPDLALRWGTLALTGHAVMRLDAGLQPEADGTLDVVGHAPALEAMARAGLLPARTAMAINAVLALLAAPAPDKPVSLPVQIRDGVLIVARFPLLRLPKLDWGPP